MSKRSPFRNLKVVELASVLAGPLVGSFFAELGAEVLKIENLKSGGDPTRQWRIDGENRSKSYSAYYASANYGKKSKFLDLQESLDREVVEKLVKECHIFITNIQNHKLLKLGFDFERMKKINPTLIYAQLHAYERDDERPGYDMVMQAECGLISMTGVKESLAKIPIPVVDIIASHQMKEAILIAMLEQKVDKKPKRVEVSLFKSGVSSLSYQASNYLLEGRIGVPMGTFHPNIAPYGDQYKTKDEVNFMLMIGSDQQFEMLKKCINFDSQVDFCNNQSRLVGRQELNKILSDIFMKKTMEEWSLVFRDNRIPYSQINNVEECLTDPIAKKMIQKGSIDEEINIDQLSSLAFEIN